MKKIKFEIFYEDSNSNKNEFVSRLKIELKSIANSIFEGMQDDLEIDEAVYTLYYSNLGRLLYQIESIKSFKHFLLLAIEGKFQEILDISDEEGFQDFISRI